jgi:hypothetical protein
VDISPDRILLIGGALIGLGFGAAVQRSRMCMMAAVSNRVLMGDSRQMHAYLLAVAVAVAGTAGLEAGGWVPIAESAYRGGRIDWLGTSLGGLLFGFGAVLAGGCVGRTLVAAAEGNGGSLLALLVFALAAAATQYGMLEPLRVWLFTSTAVDLPGGTAALAELLGLPGWALAGLFVAACLVVVLGTGRRGRSLPLLSAGAAVGALVVAGWWLTGHLAQDEFDPARPQSLTFSGPVARAMVYLTTGGLAERGFDLALLTGTLAGAVASSLLGNGFRWVAPAPRQVAQAMSGGTLMGIGAILAGGCNFGQGLSGLSTLSLGSVIAVTGIVAGMRLGLAWLERSVP